MTLTARPKLFGGAALMLGALGSALAGYSIEALGLHDGERAIPGLLYGLGLFSLFAVIVFVIFRSNRPALLYSLAFLMFAAWLLAMVTTWALEH